MERIYYFIEQDLCQGFTIVFTCLVLIVVAALIDLWAGIDAAVFFLCLVAFLLLGFLGNFWHPAWLLFLLVPIVASLGEAVKKRNASAFAFPVLVTAVYLFLGCVWEFWHPAWIIFLSVPLYYTIAELFHKK